jgi:hypothetical protein
LLHHNNVGVTYAGIFNFKMELVRSIPLYYVAKFQSMVTITKSPFITTLAHTIVGMRSKPQTPRGTKLTMHTKMPREANKVFVG